MAGVSIPLLVERITKSILLMRGEKVLLDEDLAALYGVEVKVLNQAVKRNLERFPDDFMFQLTPEEADSLRSQIVTIEPGRGRHRKYLPYAFTQEGVAMLSGVLPSEQAVRVNIEIMRAFVRLGALGDEPGPRPQAGTTGAEVRCPVPRGVRRDPRADGSCHPPRRRIGFR
jgi:hypothetical protein